MHRKMPMCSFLKLYITKNKIWVNEKCEDVFFSAIEKVRAGYPARYPTFRLAG